MKFNELVVNFGKNLKITITLILQFVFRENDQICILIRI